MCDSRIWDVSGFGRLKMWRLKYIIAFLISETLLLDVWYVLEVGI